MAEPNHHGELERLALELRELRSRLVRLEEQITDLMAAAPGQGPARRARPPRWLGQPPPPPPPAAPMPPPPQLHGPAPRPAAPMPEKQGRQESLEQQIGTRWLLVVGLGVLLLAGVFFFKFAVDKGWISPIVRVLMGTAGGLVMIGLGEWALRRGLRKFAAGLIGGGIVLLYFVVFVASPNGLYGLIGAATAFVLMCAVTAIGVAMSVRSNALNTAVIALIGAMATPLLLPTGENRQVLLMCYLLAVNTGFLALAAAKRWQVLAILAELGTAIVFTAWFRQHYRASVSFRTDLFAWIFLAQFLAYAVMATRSGRALQVVGVALVATAGPLLAILWLRRHLPPEASLGQLIALEIIVLAVCLWRSWHALRVGVLAWTTVAVAVALDEVPTGHLTREASAAWIWVFFLPFLADALLRAWRRFAAEKMDAIIAAIAVAIFYAGTYSLLKVGHQSSMGAYTAAIAGDAIIIACLLYRLAQRRWLAGAFLAQGLVLLVLAVPIQFDYTHITIAWAAQGVAAMVLAKLLGNKMLLAKSPLVLGLAFVRFHYDAAMQLPLLAQTVFIAGGVEFSYGLLLAAGLAAAMLAAAAIMRGIRLVLADQEERAIAVVLTVAAAALFAWQSCAELPALTATWLWLVPACGLAGVGLRRRSDWLTAIGAAMLAGAAVKWLAYDSLAERLLRGPGTWRALLVNWQFGTGLAAAAAVLACGAGIKRRFGAALAAVHAFAAAALLAAVLVFCNGSFEIDRYFAAAPLGAWANSHQAMQMAHSIWWAVFAAAVLLVGLARCLPPLRYLAMLVFAATLAKVFLVDMRHVHAVYRILSFMVLGAALLTGSWLYHKATRVREHDQPVE